VLSAHFSISNPWSTRFSTVWSRHGVSLWAHKYWEITLERTNTIVEFALTVRVHTDHSGITVRFGLFSYEIAFDFYDSRHWDSRNEKVKE
jgi:hypothetical protein